MRFVITRVLPVPAPARIKRGPWVVCTAESCGGLRLVEYVMALNCLDTNASLGVGRLPR